MNFAIIGCGFISKKHAEAIKNIPNAKLIAVSDMVEERMKPYIEEYGAEAYTDFKEMLENDDLDIVCICTPSGLHASIAVEVAKFKKHIVVEKPIAMSLEDANTIIDAANDNNVKLSVVHPNRFRPVVTQLKEILDKNLLGKISHVNCIVNWNRNQEYYDQAPWRGTKEHDGGVLMNQAIHNIDLLLWFMGTPKEIFSMEATRFRKIEAEDLSIGILRFENGALANVQASTTVYPRNFEEAITIFGEKGTIKIGGTNALYFKHLEYEDMNEDEINYIKDKIESNPWGIPGHQKVLENMMESIITDKETAITGEDASNSLKLVLKMYESADENKVVNWDN